MTDNERVELMALVNDRCRTCVSADHGSGRGGVPGSCKNWDARRSVPGRHSMCFLSYAVLVGNDTDRAVSRRDVEGVTPGTCGCTFYKREVGP